jgi:O-antigen/teichoic acid export membrane protein
MALLTKDPFMLRRAGWLFALAVPAALYLAYEAREDEPRFAALTAILALVSGLISAWSFRRSNASDGKSMEAEKKNHKAVLAVASVGWVAFGVFYGLLQDNTLAFLVSLVPAAISAAAAFYLWRREASG